MKALFIFALLVGLVVCERFIVYDRSYAPPNWELVQRASPAQQHTINIALPQRNLDVLERVYNEVSDPDSPKYGEFLKPKDILSIITPEEELVKKVSNWLEAYGVTSQENLGDAIRVTTSVKVVEALFQTRLFNFKHTKTGRPITRSLGKYSIPTTLKSSIYMVTGVSDFPPTRNDLKTYGAPDDTDGLVIPLTIQTLYNIPQGTTITTNSSQAPIEFQGYAAYTNSDMKTFWQQTGVPAQPASKIVGPYSGVGIESVLDYQYITAIGQQAKNWYWTENDWLYDFSLSFFKNAEVPYVISLSWGWSEADQCEIDTDCSNMGITSSQYVERINTEFQKIGLRGVTILVASGDSGANGRTDEYCSVPGLRPDFPAASPYVTSVGATELNPVTKTTTTGAPVCQTTPCSLAGKEVAVSYQRSFFASGGGFSNVAAQPAWQLTAVSNYLKSGAPLPPATYFNSSSRGYPDIAALGHNFVIVANGYVQQVGGTSASAPTVAGVLALLNDYRFKRNLAPIGPFNPLLYKIAAAHPSAFNDITVGDNKCTEGGCSSSCYGFTCAAGWDPVTGWGSPNYQELIKYLTAIDNKIVEKKRKAAKN